MEADPRDALPLKDRQALLDQARDFAAVSRSVIQDIVKSGFEVQAKQDTSLVTTADLEVERELRRMIAELNPEHGVLGEEFPELNPTAEYKWIIDPIDGTEAFANGIPTYGTVLSLYYKELPLIGVLDQPALDLCTSGGYQLGVSCNGSELRPFDTVEEKDPETLRLITSKRKNFFPLWR